MLVCLFGIDWGCALMAEVIIAIGKASIYFALAYAIIKKANHKD
ncbi:hypothetical protein HMPREF0527_00582 [Lactobacillus jensenii SJ-7A-US]|nr:hypothetical protein LACJE0001_0403 [Lactobacillus jensenii 269-3]EEX27530.1 hypothetical protein HMPREF0527_00582 [Lactobacillus jensenii SJ-7A-US]